ncbi:hypothetical protein CEXT_585861 [Caerostris extrusa]|uniref:Secreted protein n=1 Tax=Caerostris extrusa TaxID=172846 RepID=A0AAV4TBI1_CAEEX|nr:hypothetical protein CEXT_585861 [Caerostris extrusa]
MLVCLISFFFSFRASRSTAILQGEATEHSCRRRTDSGAAVQDREPSWKCAVEQRWIRFGSSAERLFTGLLYVVSEERKGLQTVAEFHTTNQPTRRTNHPPWARRVPHSFILLCPSFSLCSSTSTTRTESKDSY